MSDIKATPHIHEWSKHLYNPWGCYWFHVCKGSVKEIVKDKIERWVPCKSVERWTTIIARRSEIPEVKNEGQEKEILRRLRDD